MERCSKLVPRLDGVVINSGNNIPPIGRVSNRTDSFSMHHQWLANYGPGLSIPNSSGPVLGSGDDVPSIGRVSNGGHTPSIPL